jgi:VIT1/CCC1 family predicted Fe2+/Mn2+ transporter
MIVGLNEATSSKLTVFAGIVIMALADGLADAAGFHIVEEAEVENGRAKHTMKEVWVSTIVTFIAVGGFISTFAIPVLLFQLKTAIILDIAWGMLLLILLNYYIARSKKEDASRLILGHISLALFVVIVSYFAGRLMSLLIM